MTIIETKSEQHPSWTDGELEDTIVEALGERLREEYEEHGDESKRVWALARRFSDAMRSLPSGSIAAGCDACEYTYDADLLDAADLPSLQQCLDANGDPDVAICGLCVYEARMRHYEDME